ncbi:MAG: hypothetical protein Q8K64_07545 [Sediminibacterium sp.]|nr:hypothetical protein [Sediminibacterium sp.]
MVSFTDFENQSHTIVTYQNDKPVALYSVKDTKSLFASVFTKRVNGSVGQQIASACTEQTSILKLPNGRDSVIYIKANGGGIACPGTQTFWQKLGSFFSGIWDGITDALNWLFSWGGGGSDGGVNSGGYTGGGSFGSGGYSGWYFSGFSGGSYNGTDPNGGSWGPYDPYNSNNIDEDILLDDSNPNAGYDDGSGDSNGADNSTFQIIDPTQPIPKIADIMGVNNFVRRLTPNQNCLELSRQQIAKLGYKVGGYMPGSQTYQIYSRANGINKNTAIEGVSYIVNALQKNIPVVIGVDYGVTSPNTDLTTNHFVVVVGMDKDPTGRLIFRFYDNYTSDPEFGAHPLNIVTYDPITGSLTGSWVGTKSHLPIFYKVAQIRKSYK